MIELGKKYRTRDGREVRIYAVDGVEGDEIHGSAKSSDGNWDSYSWSLDGKYNSPIAGGSDLIEVQPEVWRPIFINLCGESIMSSTTYPTKEAAMAHEPVHPIDAWLDPRSGK